MPWNSVKWVRRSTDNSKKYENNGSPHAISLVSAVAQYSSACVLHLCDHGLISASRCNCSTKVITLVASCDNSIVKFSNSLWSSPFRLHSILISPIQFNPIQPNPSQFYPVQPCFCFPNHYKSIFKCMLP